MNTDATCPECGNGLRGDEVLCPQCGAPVTHQGKRFAGTRAFVWVFIGVAVVSALAMVLLPR